MTAIRFGFLALGLAACLAPAASRAVELGLAPYVEYDAGVTFMRNQNLTRANPPIGGLSGRVESNTGFNVGGAVGLKFLEHFRTEVNLGYRQNETEKLHIQPGVDDAKGSLSMLSVLFNTYAEYDFDIGVNPYFGLGVGYGRVELDSENKNSSFQVDSVDNAFLWNVMAGVSIPFSDITTFNVGYRYLATDDLNFRACITGPCARRNDVRPVPRRQVDSEYDAHELVLGVRYSF
jgi:opacity protein-like surface antigen